jgi:hypothetical protein
MVSPRSLLVWCLTAGLLLTCGGVEAAKKKILLKPQYNPDLPKIGLLDGIEKQAISVQMVAKNAEEGAILVENLTDQPLTVELPEAFVGVQVLPQDDGFGLGGGGGTSGSGGGGGGQNQAAGGGFGGGGIGGGGGLGGGGGGGGFFSVPPEQIARIPYQSVCLEHGKAEPRPQVKYKLIAPEQYSSDPKVHELLKMVGTGRLNKASAQAAAWHLASGMSWEELASKKYNNLGRPDTPYFHPSALYEAQAIVAEATGRAKAAAEKGEQPAESPIKSRVPAKKTADAGR